MTKEHKNSGIFQENLKTLMRRWDLSNRKLGDLLGIKSSNVDTLRRGVTKPSVRLILQIERLSGVAARHLYNSKLDIVDFPVQPILTKEVPVVYDEAGEPLPTYRTAIQSVDLAISDFFQHIDGLSKDLQALRKEFDEFREDLADKKKK